MSTLDALACSLQEFIRTTPSAANVIRSLATWLHEIAATAALAPVPPSGHPSERADPLQRERPNAQPESPVEPPAAIIEPKAVESAPEALEAGQRAVLARWANPEVSPKISPTAMTAIAAPASAPAAPVRPSFDFAQCRQRLKHHLRAIGWASSCAKHGFDENSAAYRELLETGKREQIFFWEANRIVRDFREPDWRAFRDLYTAVDAAIELYLEDPSTHFRTAGVFRVVAAAVLALHAALEPVRDLGFFDSDIEDLFRLCANHPTHGASLPSGSACGAPLDLAAFRRRLAAIRSGIREEIAAEKAPGEALKKLGYHLGKLKKNPGNADEQSKSICAALQAWVDAGKSISDLRLREHFLSLATPEDLPIGVRKHPLGAAFIAALDGTATDGVDEAHADADANPADTDSDDAFDARINTQEIRAVREALQGKRVVIIGGDERPMRKAAIERAFNLSELVWVATRPHETHNSLIGPIRDDDTALVLLLIRWSSHSYGEMNKVCAEYEKPLVRLPAGYNPAMIAREVIDQAGARLGIA